MHASFRASPGLSRRTRWLRSKLSLREVVERNGCPCHLPSATTWPAAVLSTSRRWKSTNTAFSSVEDENEDAKMTFLQQELDFFGEPVTFRGSETKKVTRAMAAFDGFLLCVVSKGRSCTGGGDECGLETKSAHSVALSWSEALRFASVWNETTTTDSVMSCPMLAVITVAPVLAQAGVGYVKQLDCLLAHVKPAAPGMPVITMHGMALVAASCRDDTSLDDRERMHLQALHHLLLQDHPSALNTYMRILRICPGDALALVQAMDLAHVLGDRQAAFRAAGSVASYWNERRGGIVTPSIPGHTMATSLIALGFAVGGRDEDGEQMAARAMKQGRGMCGALATWAQAHVFDARGRVAEGISALANFDGVSNYEGAGLLFFDCRLGGYGARFSLDREERGRGKSASLRLYEANFQRVLDYSGFAIRQSWQRPSQSAPLAWKDSTFLGEESPPTLLDRVLGKSKNDATSEWKSREKKLTYDMVVKRLNLPSTQIDGWEPSCEDVLTWIPPTPLMLSDATMLLLRFTLNGTVSARNARWDSLRNAWSSMFEIQEKFESSLRYSPVVCLAASLVLPPQETGGDQVAGGALAHGLHLFGTLLKLGNPTTESEKTTSIRELIAERDPNFWLPAKESGRNEWKEVVGLLSSAIDGRVSGAVDVSTRLSSWHFETRPLLEHAICYAACKSGDVESLSMARSICSQGVTLRTNSPEEWWRYSIVLGLLGDDVASEDALNNSINFGGGQGAKS